MYERILVGLDGSECSDHAGKATLALSKSMGCGIVACHVYAAEMHRARFNEMELGLPERYQEQGKLERLRDTHEDIISSGMKVISDAYLAAFLKKGADEGLKIDCETPEGRNYTRFLEVLRRTGAGLAVIGAEGQGKVRESTLGSFAERVLLLGGGADVLVARRGWALKGRPIVVGIDGSEQSHLALRRANELARIFGSSVKAVAVYDPFFHSGVFSSISSALTEGQASKFNFAAQERLHDEIIDDGLRALYDKRLNKAMEIVGQTEVPMHREILTGKVFSQLSHYASAVNAGLLVVGRFGVHREEPSLIGSTPHALARIATTNLLVVDGGEGMATASKVNTSGTTRTVVPENPRQAAEIPPRLSLNNEATEAEMVVLKKVKKFAPAFHEHIVRSRIIGQAVQAGMRFMVFDVVETSPPGNVTVTLRTRLEFV